MQSIAPTRDRFARRVALVALAFALGGYAVGAHADPTTEPDAAALEVRVGILEQRISDDRVANADIINLAGRVDELERVAVPRSCVAYSERHYYKERVGFSKRRWRLPVMVWNMSEPTCRPNPDMIWQPQRAAATLVGSR